MIKGWIASSSWHSPRALLLSIFLLVASPAFFYGCSYTEPESPDLNQNDNYDDDKDSSRDPGSVHTDIRFLTGAARHDTKSESWWLMKRMDIFVFNDGEVQNLDSYRREYAYTNGTVSVASGEGDKLVVAIANSRLTNDDISKVSVYEDLNGIRTLLVDDNPEYPLMTGEGRFCAGSDNGCAVVLYPMMSEIHIASVSCDMDGAYTGKYLQKVKAYLTNVSNSTEMMRWDGFRPSEILNNGRFSESDMQRLSCQRMLYNYIGNGKKSATGYSYGSASLYCYPNDSREESAGTPFTTLVIEGLLDGKTQYYPIRINRNGYGHSIGTEGIQRNARYVMNISITGPGVDDPDGVVPPKSTVTEGSMTVYPANFITGRDGERIHVWVDVFPEETEVWIDEDDLDFDRERGIYDYEIDVDGKGVWLDLLKGGSGAFIINAGPPIDDGLLVIIVVNP